MRVKVPRAFVEDHAARGLVDLEAATVRMLARHYVLDLEPAAVADLLDDARHYAYEDSYGFEYAGLRSSARATVRALEAVAS